MIQVFISHNAEDAVEGERLRADLAQSRPDEFVVFLSSEHGHGPRGGTSWRSWISRTMRSCDVVVFIAGSEPLSPWVSAELGMARLLDKPIVPLGIDATVPVNPVIDTIQAAPLDQPIEAIIQLIDEQVVDPLEGLTDVGPGFVPYPGLVQLDEDQEPLLSGRREERGRVLGTFGGIVAGNPRLVVVSGPSGSGKSSLIRAGIVPRLRADGWSLAGPTQPSQLAESGFPDPGSSGRRVVIVDQAEELVLQSPETRSQMERWLIECIASDISVLVIIRIEFRDELGGVVDGIGQAGSEPRDVDEPRKPVDHYIPYLGAAELYEVVRRPARLVQLGVSEDLVDRLVRETGTGAALPLLCYTLHELWEDRDRARFELRESSLEALRGVTGVLNTRASEALDRATGGDPALVQPVLALLSRLASPAQNPPTRSPVKVETLSTEQRAWIDEFRKVGLVTYRTSYALGDQISAHVRPTGQDLVDATHEALFAWGPLAGAIDRERDRNLNRTAIQGLASQWHARDKADSTLLLAGDRLRFAVDEGLADGEGGLGEFVRASRRHDRDRRLRRLLVGVVVVALIVAAGAAVVAFAQWAQASTERDRAQRAEVRAESIRVAAQANEAIDAERDVALLAAVEAYRIDPNVDTEGALFNALSTPTGPIRYFSDEAAEWSTLRFLDESTGIVVDRNLQPANVDLATRELDVIPVPGLEVAGLEPGTGSEPTAIRGRRPPSTWSVGVVEPGSGAVALLDHPVEVTAAVPTPTGLAFGDVDGTIFVADLEEVGSLGEALLVDRHVGAEITGLAVSPDGELLASASPGGVKVNQRRGGAWEPASVLLALEPGARASESVVLRQDEPVDLFAAGSDPTIRRWTSSDGVPLETDPVGSHRGSVAAMALDPETPLLYTGGLEGLIQLWDVESRAPLGDLLAHENDVRGLSTFGDGRLISTDADTAILWDLRDERIVERSGVIPAGWREERFRSLVEGDGPLAAVTVDGRVLVSDGTTFSAPPDTRKAWWTADQMLVVETGDAAQVDRPPSGLWLVDESGHLELGSGFDAVAVGRCIAAVGDGPTVGFIDVGNCGPAPDAIHLDGEQVAELALTGDERKLLIVDVDNQIQERFVEDGSPGRSSELAHGITATSARWLTDDRVIVGHDRDGDVVIVDLDGSEGGMVVVAEHDDAVWWLTVDEGRGRLFSAGQDGLIVHTDLNGPTRVGNPLIGSRRQRENHLAAVVRGLRLTHNGNALVAIHGSRIVAWELEPEALVDRACADVHRTLEPSEAARLGLDGEAMPCG